MIFLCENKGVVGFVNEKKITRDIIFDVHKKIC